MIIKNINQEDPQKKVINPEKRGALLLAVAKAVENPDQGHEIVTIEIQDAEIMIKTSDIDHLVQTNTTEGEDQGHRKERGQDHLPEEDMMTEGGMNSAIIDGTEMKGEGPDLHLEEGTKEIIGINKEGDRLNQDEIV